MKYLNISSNQSSNQRMRYERKYKINHLEKAVANQMVHLHPASFRKIYPDRWINNIYFDTPDFITYQQNVVGAPQRAKFRIRWYGADMHNITLPTFEIKAKHNELGSKKQLSFDPFSLIDLAKATQKVNQIAPTGAILQPTLMNRYLRSYFGTSDGKFRLTIDNHLGYHAIIFNLPFDKYQFEDFATIIELKYDNLEDEQIDHITQFIPFRVTKSSKYVTGIAMTLGF